MLFCGFLSGPGLNQVTSTFWSVTQSLHGGEQATIPHMEEDSQSFHMIPNAQIFISEITLIRANYTFICVAPRMIVLGNRKRIIASNCHPIQ